MTHRLTALFARRPKPSWRCALMAITLSLVIGVAPALAIPAPVALSGAARASAEQSAPPWWAAFDDPVLGRLMDGPHAAPDRQAALFRSYVELQVGALRMRIARQIEALARQQMDFVEQADAPTEGRQQLLDLLARRGEHVAAVLTTLDQENQQRLTVLAALKGVGPGPLTALLMPADGAPQVPQVNASVPDRLSTLAAHHEHGDGPRQQALRMLDAAAERATRAQQLLQANRLNVDALKLRHEAGAADPLAVMAAQLDWLVQADQYVKAAGALALAWAQLLQLTGDSISQVARP